MVCNKALTQSLFNSAIEHGSRRNQVDREGLKLNGTQQLLVYAGDGNILVGSIHTIQKNTESLTVVNYQRDAQFFYYYFYNIFTISLYMFRVPSAAPKIIRFLVSGEYCN
jgi:hypothetical protein